MDKCTIRKKLQQEYVRTYSTRFIYWAIKSIGLNRYNISNNQIVKLSVTSRIYSFFMLIVVNSSLFYVLYVTVIKSHYLLQSEILLMLQFVVTHNSLSLNINTVNANSGVILITHCIDIDIFFGIDETKFLRERESAAYRIYVLFFAFFLMMILLVLMVTYNVEWQLYFVGGFLFYAMYFYYFDACFFMRFYTFLTLRARYLNVALMKITEMKLEYLPKTSFVDGFLWKKEYDDKIDVRNIKSPDTFITGYRMLFNMLRSLERSYSSSYLVTSWSVIVGLLLSVQTFAIYISSTNVETVRTVALSGWAALNWVYLMYLCLQASVFTEQIEQTKLISHFSQLKPNNSDDVFKLLKKIIGLIEIRDFRISGYGLFYLDPAYIFGITTSILVYVTVILQFNFPKLEPALSKWDNTTSSPPLLNV